MPSCHSPSETKGGNCPKPEHRAGQEHEFEKPVQWPGSDVIEAKEHGERCTYARNLRRTREGQLRSLDSSQHRQEQRADRDDREQSGQHANRDILRLDRPMSRPRVDPGGQEVPWDRPHRQREKQQRNRDWIVVSSARLEA